LPEEDNKMPFYYTPDISDKLTSYREEFSSFELTFAVMLKDDFTRKEPIGNIKVRMKKGENEEIKDEGPNVISAEKNYSGYYVFKALRNNGTTDAKYTVKIEPDLYYTIEKEKVDLSEITRLDLEFDGNGPGVGTISFKLNDVSELTEGDAIEFRNLTDDPETRRVMKVDSKKQTISWRGELKKDYSAGGSKIISMRDPIKKITLKPKPAYPFPDNITLIRGRVLDINPSSPPKIKVDERIETTTDERGEFVLYLRNVKVKEIVVSIEINGSEKLIHVPIQKENEKISLGKISFS
jgi:hypothetical protein